MIMERSLYSLMSAGGLVFRLSPNGETVSHSLVLLTEPICAPQEPEH